MILQKWLTINKNGATRITQSQPALEANEISMRLVIELPDALFKKPRLEAHITIPESATVSEIISAETVDNVEEIIKQNTGLALKISVVTDEEKVK